MTWLFVAFGSTAQHWTGLDTPDSEFYATLGLFGSDVTDRSVDPAYTWTRLGYIAPVRLLVTVLGPWAGFAARRFVLIVIIVASLYAIVRMTSTRELAVMVAAVALGFALISSHPPGVLFALFLAYALSGYVIAFVDWLNRRKRLARPE